jgi:hypothetical protein
MLDSCRLAATAFVIQSGSGCDDVNETLETVVVVYLETSDAHSGTAIFCATSLIKTGGKVVTKEIFVSGCC